MIAQESDKYVIMHVISKKKKKNHTHTHTYTETHTLIKKKKTALIVLSNKGVTANKTD